MDAKRYLISSLVTFATAFLIGVLPMVGNVGWESAALFGLIAAGVRAGVKALVETAGYRG